MLRGQLDWFYLAFGEAGLVTIVDLPDDAAAALTLLPDRTTTLTRPDHTATRAKRPCHPAHTVRR